MANEKKGAGNALLCVVADRQGGQSAVSVCHGQPWEGLEDTLPSGYDLRPDGLYQRKNESGEVRISGPVWVTAKTRNDQGGEWGMVICWLDPDGTTHTQAFARQLLHDTRGAAIARTLADGGLEIAPGCERALLGYLGGCDPEARLEAVSKLGWVNGDRLAYVLPEHVLHAGDTAGIIYQPERYSPTLVTMRPRGTLAQWQENVARPCEGNPILIFGLLAALAAPLLKHAGMDSGGFHLYGNSSTGKTTALQCAASVWGCGADPATSDGSHIRKWHATANALEGIAAAHNDGLLALDGHCRQVLGSRA